MKTNGSSTVHVAKINSGGGGGSGPANPYVLQPDGTDGIDAYIDNAAPTSNFGTNASLYATDLSDPQIIRSLIRFDISALAGKTAGNTSTLTFYSWDGSDFPVTVDCTIHRVTRTWTEAGVTWNKYDGTNNWTTPGGDYTTPSDSATAGTNTLVFTGAGLAAILQDAIDSRSGIVNLLLRHANESGLDEQLRLGSSDNATAALRPRLSVAWTPPA